MRIEHLADGITLYNADCREVLPTLGKVDAVVTDPPYGVGENYLSFDDTADNLRLLIASTIPELMKIADRVVLTSGTKNLHDYPKPKWTMAWVTPAGTGCGPWGFTCWQPILCYGKDPYLSARKGSRPDIIQHTEKSEKNGHPCPKPINFMKKLLERTSFEGHEILDPFMGSGTTGVAAVQLGRKFIGIEIEPKYFDIACQRIEAARGLGIGTTNRSSQPSQ